MSNLFWLTEAQMSRLRPFFPKSHGRPRSEWHNIHQPQRLALV